MSPDVKLMNLAGESSGVCPCCHSAVPVYSRLLTSAGWPMAIKDSQCSSSDTSGPNRGIKGGILHERKLPLVHYYLRKVVMWSITQWNCSVSLFPFIIIEVGVLCCFFLKTLFKMICNNTVKSEELPQLHSVIPFICNNICQPIPLLNCISLRNFHTHTHTHITAREDWSSTDCCASWAMAACSPLHYILNFNSSHLTFQRKLNHL